MSRITIGMPVYNDVNFIEESIKSILTQTYKNFEFIISDDCSTDGSDLICKKYLIKDSRIRYIRQPKNLGISKNMEFLLKRANTKYFMWAGDDDILAPTFIETLIKSIENNIDSISAFCTFSSINEKGNITTGKQNFDYSNSNKLKRLSNFIRNSNDTFGYGIFITNEIKEVELPAW